MLVLFLIIWLLPLLFWIYFMRKCNSILENEFDRKELYNDSEPLLGLFIPIINYVVLITDYFILFDPILKRNNNSFFGIKSINGKIISLENFFKKLLKV